MLNSTLFRKGSPGKEPENGEGKRKSVRVVRCACARFPTRAITHFFISHLRRSEESPGFSRQK